MPSSCSSDRIRRIRSCFGTPVLEGSASWRDRRLGGSGAVFARLRPIPSARTAPTSGVDLLSDGSLGMHSSSDSPAGRRETRPIAAVRRNSYRVGRATPAHSSPRGAICGASPPAGRANRDSLGPRAMMHARRTSPHAAKLWQPRSQSDSTLLASVLRRLLRPGTAGAIATATDTARLTSQTTGDDNVKQYTQRRYRGC